MWLLTQRCPVVKPCVESDGVRSLTLGTIVKALQKAEVGDTVSWSKKVAGKRAWHKTVRTVVKMRKGRAAITALVELTSYKLVGG